MLGIIGVISAVLPIVFCELTFLKVHRRIRVGLHPPEKPDKERVEIKLLGFYGSLALIMAFYALIPPYSNDSFYEVGFIFLLPLLLAFVVGGWIYIYEMDPRLKDPYDAYWHFGNILALRWDKIDYSMISKHLRSLLLRAFFLPNMLVYLVLNIELITDGWDDFSQQNLGNIEDISGLGLLKLMVVVYFFLAAMDTIFAVIGYIMAFKILDSDIQSTEPTFLGWFICIICYYPFWEVVMISLFFHDFYSNPEWNEWLEGMPLIIIIIWGGLVLSGVLLEALTTLTFGIRFSNLTYRGLISDGTFRLSKHPQYVFKMLNRFCFYMPFLSLFGVLGVIKTMLMFAGLCFVYYLRARTEENHLVRYPEYVEYANWMNENGIFRHVAKYIPFLIFSEQKARAGRLF